MPRRKNRRRSRGLGNLDTSHLKCEVFVGESGTADILGNFGRLTETQCSRFPAGDYIGRGNFASAFQHAFDPNKVVKFTIDERDAKASQKMIGKNLKGAVKVFDVAQLKNVEGAGYEIDYSTQTYKRVPKAVFGIVTEQVRPIYPDFKDDWGPAIKAAEFVVDKIHRQLKPGPGFKFPSTIHSDANAACSKIGKLRPEDNVDIQACQIRARSLLDAVEEIGQHGTSLNDLAIRNWGLRDGQPVVLDLGFGVNDPDNQAIELAGLRRIRRQKRKNRRR